MSTKYPGGFITKNYVAPTPSSASGIWTLDQQQQAQQAGIWPFGGPFNYIEDVFSTYLYTGNGSTQTITNGIDLSTKGGLVWIKGRNGAGEGHTLFDTARGVNQLLQTQNIDGSANFNNSLTAFNTTGFSLGTNRTDPSVNFASWTLRKQPKFFDIQTWTGDGANRTISHALGSVPGCIMVKRTDTTGAWQVYHRSLANTEYLVLNTTAAVATGATRWNSTTATSTVFSLGTDATVNASGGTYIAYIFAHDAGGFGAAGTDNVISCGSVTTDGSGNATANLGYEPQWVLLKPNYAGGVWYIVDSMRGNSALNGTNNTEKFFQAQSSAAEASTYGVANPTATGFVSAGWASGDTLIYIAIRRGPMKVPTTGTSVFTPIARNGTGTNTIVTGVGFPSDLALIKLRSSGNVTADYDRLRGSTANLQMNVTDAEAVYTGETVSFDQQNGFGLGPSTSWEYTNRLASPNAYINWLFRRAPGYFDVVCYTGTGVTRTVTHNLGVAPELMIIKSRSAATDWRIYSAAIGAGSSGTIDTGSFSANGALYWNSTAPTSTVFTLGSGGNINTNAATFVAYLFATCAGVSKVGSYTGTGTTQAINCGFTAGSRFVMIKRTDSSGDWYVWDSARGIIAGDDPYLLINSTAAEVTNTDYVDTYSAGFEISSTAPAAINANGGTFIFLAIA